MRNFIKKYINYFVVSIIFAIAAAIFDVQVSYQIKNIIDTITLNKLANLNLVLFLFVTFKLLHHAMFFGKRVIDIRYQPMILQNSVVEIFTKLMQHSLHWFDSHLSGEISSKIADYQSSLITLINYAFIALNSVALIIISLYFLLQINYLPALLLLVFIVVYTPVIYFLLKKQMVLQENYTYAKQSAIGLINDSIANVFALKIVGNVNTEFKLKLLPAINNWRQADRKAKWFDAYWLDNADTIIAVLMTTGQIILLAYLYKIHLISAGSFAFIAMNTLSIHYNLVRFLEGLLFNIIPSLAQLKASYNFVYAPIEVIDAKNAIVLTKCFGEIIYKDVVFSYANNKTNVLQDVNLHIKPGEHIGIVGTSGAGKTTFVKCLLRYFDINRGCIMLDGQDIRNITQESLRANIAIIPQDITLFHRSITDNLLLAKSDATMADIVAACKRAKIHDDIMKMEFGYETIVGERGVKLSGGQRQRIAIARAMLKKATILIFDEATSNLDTPTEKLIQESMHDVLTDTKITVIAIAHRLSTLQNMNRIIVMHNGKIIEEGSHNSLIKQENSVYSQLWLASNDNTIT